MQLPCKFFVWVHIHHAVFLSGHCRLLLAATTAQCAAPERKLVSKCASCFKYTLRLCDYLQILEVDGHIKETSQNMKMGNELQTRTTLYT